MGIGRGVVHLKRPHIEPGQQYTCASRCSISKILGALCFAGRRGLWNGVGYMVRMKTQGDDIPLAREA